MFKKLSGSIVTLAVNNNIVASDKVQENIYGINSLLTLSLNIVTAAFVGAVFGMLIEIAIFIVTYKLLRKYCGGSHAKTPLKCYISSCITYIVVLLVIRYYSFSGLTTTVITACSGVLLFILSPVEAIKKPLDDIEKKVFRFRSRMTIIIFVLIYGILHYMPYTYYYSIIVSVSIITVTIFSVEGKIQLIRHKKAI